MLVSDAEQSDSVGSIHVSLLFQIIFLFRSLHNIEQSSMCCTIVGPSPTMKSTSRETLQHQFPSTSTLKGDMMKAWSIISSKSGGITVGKGPRNNTFPNLTSEIEAVIPLLLLSLLIKITGSTLCSFFNNLVHKSASGRRLVLPEM